MIEGRMEAEHWLNWLQKNSTELKAAMPPGWWLRLRPQFLNESINRTAALVVDGISYVLVAMKEPHEKTDRFARAAEADFREYVKQSDAKRRELHQQIKPVLSCIKQQFPKFAGLIKRRLETAEELEPGASEEELAAVEQAIGFRIPGALRRLFQCSRWISLDGLSLQISLFVHPVASQLVGTQMVCFGEYWLKADGDQVLFRSEELLDDDPLVYYYAHAIPAVEPTKKWFTAWLESLSRSSMFRD